MKDKNSKDNNNPLVNGHPTWYPVPESRSVGIIEKAGVRRAGSVTSGIRERKEEGGDLISLLGEENNQVFS